jgi:hypothetical protein
MDKLPDDKVIIKISVCQKCNGVVRTAVKHMLQTKSKNEFMKEAMQYNLAIKEIPLLEMRKAEIKWCKC